VNSKPLTLEEVRERLRAQGYLETGLERAIFTAPKASGAVLPSVVAAAVACAAASAAAADVKGAISPPFGVVFLFLALFFADLLPSALGGVLLYGATRVFRVPRNPKLASYGAAVVAACLPFFLYTVGLRSLPGGEERPAFLPVVGVSLAAFYFARAVRATTLSLALRRHVPLPERPYFRRGTAAAVAVLILLSLLLGPRAAKEEPLPPLRVTSGERLPLLLVALDGVSPAQFRQIFPEYASSAWSRKKGSPPEIWTTIATGVNPARHGVRAFERIALFRTYTVRTPFGAAWAIRGPLSWLGIAARVPVSGSERRAYAFWEVAARAGISSLAVNWWSSERMPGVSVVENREVALDINAGASNAGTSDDAAAIRRFQSERARGRPALATIYLPGADIDRGPPTLPARTFVAAETERARKGLQEMWVVVDSGRKGRNGGLELYAREARSTTREVRPEDIAPTVLAWLGLPAAKDLEGFPLFSLFEGGLLERGTVATYGARGSKEPAAQPTEAGREYLRRLRALGYLN
jgi:hypothetical protein